MSVSASTAIALGAPILDVEAFVSRLSAEQRAQLVWAMKPLGEGVHRLRTESLTDKLIAAVVCSTTAAFLGLSNALQELPESLLAIARNELASDFRSSEARLAAFLPDDDARDTLRWVTGFLGQVLSVALADRNRRPISSIPEAEIEAMKASPFWAQWWGGIVMLLAASEESKKGSSRQRAAELVDASFLALHKIRDLLLMTGLVLPAPETDAERLDRLRQTAEAIRASFTEADWTAIEDARLRELR